MVLNMWTIVPISLPARNVLQLTQPERARKNLALVHPKTNDNFNSTYLHQILTTQRIPRNSTHHQY